MTAGVYIIRNKKDQHFYVGSTINLHRRKVQHWYRLRLGIHHAIRMQNAWIRDGEDSFNFEVVAICEVHDLPQIEQYLLDKWNPEYNIAPVSGSSLGIKRRQETKDKISALHKGKKDGPPSEAHRRSISEAKKGIRPYIATEQSRANQSAALKKVIADGRFFGPEHRAKISSAKLGHPTSEETKKKISASRMGQSSEESKAGAALGRHIRWHVQRGIKSDSCGLCVGGGPPEAYGND